MAAKNLSHFQRKGHGELNLKENYWSVNDCNQDVKYQCLSWISFSISQVWIYTSLIELLGNKKQDKPKCYPSIQQFKSVWLILIQSPSLATQRHKIPHELQCRTNRHKLDQFVWINTSAVALNFSTLIFVVKKKKKINVTSVDFK